MINRFFAIVLRLAQRPVTANSVASINVKSQIPSPRHFKYKVKLCSSNTLKVFLISIHFNLTNSQKNPNAVKIIFCFISLSFIFGVLWYIFVSLGNRILLWGAVPVSHSALNKESVIMVAKLKPTKSRKSQRVKRGSFQGLLYCSQRSKLQSPLTSHYVKLGK